MTYDKIFPATWVSDDGQSYFSAEARKLGYRSKKRWEKLRRVPDPSAVPSLVVSQVARCRGRPCAPILRVLPDDVFEYAAECYCVYLEADTVVAPTVRKARKSVLVAAVPPDLPSDRPAETAPACETARQREHVSSSVSCPVVCPFDAAVPDNKSVKASSTAVLPDLPSDCPTETASESQTGKTDGPETEVFSSVSRPVVHLSDAVSSRTDVPDSESAQTSSTAVLPDLPSDRRAETASESQTGKTADQRTDVSSFFSCPSVTPPYDVGFSRKAKRRNELAKTKTAVLARSVNNGERTRKGGRKAEEWEYLPEGFDWSKAPKSLVGGVRYLFHLIYVNMVIIHRRIKTTEYVNLNARTFKQIVWNGDAVRYWAVKSGLVQCDNFYEKGRKSLGYRLCPELAQRTWRLTRRTNKAIVRNLRKTEDERSPVVRWLTRNLGRIEAVIPEGLPWLDELALQAVNDGCIAFNPEDEFGRRYHSNLTNLRSDLRKYLRVDGKPLVQIDISNSQPLFQAVVAERLGVACPAYKRACEEGRLYEFLGGKTGLSRERTKRQMMASVFFGRNASRSRTKRAFRKYFPEVAVLLDKIKVDGHAELARLLQRAESDFVVRTVCDRLRRKYPKMFVATIHDSIVTNSREDAAIVLETMREEFVRLGIEPKLEIEDL